MYIITYIFIFLFGLIIGSFINCLVWRLHKKETLWGRSYCPHCRKHIAWYDNIPVISFFILRAKCRKCREKISWQYPAVEFITGLLFLIAFITECSSTAYCLLPFAYDPTSLQTYLPTILILRNWFIISVMIIIFIYDLRWYYILDKVTIPAMIVVFVLNLLLGHNLWNLLFSGIIGGSFFLFQFVISKGKWIGGGDIRLGALMGLILGWPMVLMALFLAYILGSIVGIGLILAGKKKWGSEVPFGVFLSTATVVALFWGQQIVDWYFNLLIF